MGDWPSSASRKLYTYKVTGADKASIDTNVDGSTIADFAGFDVLDVLAIIRTDKAVVFDSADVTVNNDTGANYDRQIIEVVNTTVSGGNALAAAAWSPNVAGNSKQANVAGILRFSIPFYSETTFYKVVDALEAFTDSTAANNVYNGAVWTWRSTAAITRLKIAAQGAQKLKIGSQLIVYGR